MLAICELAMRFGSKILFEGVNLQLNPKRRYGLVGANGSGKSTLLKILAMEIPPDHGDIFIPTQLSIGTMRQDHFLYENTSLIDVVLQGKPSLWQALKDQKQLLTSTHFNEEQCQQLEKIEKIIEQYSGYSAESDAAKLLEGLGLQTSKHQQPMRSLSGGYKLRVLLAQLLFANCDLLLLDEPTNHLDVFTIGWLEDFLTSFSGTLVVVSHDRFFLNKVSTDILDVDHSTIRHYSGNYDQFVSFKSSFQLQAEKQILNQEKRRDQLLEFVERFGAKATKARQAQSKMHLVDKLNQSISETSLGPSSRRAPHLKFTLDKPSGSRVLLVHNLCKNYGSLHVLDGVSFEIEKGEKVAFLGANGIGKTTLLEVITSHLEATSGEYKWGINTEVAYFPQDPRRALDLSMSPLEWLCSNHREITEQSIRSILATVLIEGDSVHQPISTLSGGEMARLILAQMIVKKPNVLIFDEPTNHLDMESIEVLLEALGAFPGTVLLVSHNRYFVSNFAMRIIEIQSHGIVDYKCSYSEYVAKRENDLLDRHQRLATQKNASKEQEGKQNYEAMREKRKRRTQLEREIAAIEETCSSYEQEMQQLDRHMAEVSFYLETPRHEQEKIAARKQLLEKELEALLVRWEASNQELLNSS